MSRPRAAARVGLLTVTAAAVLWGTVGVTGRGLYDRTDLTSLEVGAARLVVAAGVLLAGAALVRRSGREPRATTPLPRARVAVGVVGAGLCLALYQAAYFAAVATAGVAVATLVTLGLAPVLVAVGAGATGERPSRASLVALAVAVLGLALLVGTPGGGPGLVRGAALAVGSATGYAVLTLLGRALAPHLDPVSLTRGSFTVGAVVLLGPALAGGVALPGDAVPLLLLLYLGLVPTALAYALFFRGLRTVPASTAAVLTLAEPLTATGLAVLLFDERLTRLGWTGGGLLLLAVLTLHVMPGDGAGAPAPGEEAGAPAPGEGADVPAAVPGTATPPAASRSGEPEARG